MKINKELVLEQTGLWPRMWKAVDQVETTPEDISLLKKLFLNKARDEDIAGKKIQLASVLRWIIYEASTYLAALSYILYLQRRDYFEKNGPANIHQSLLVSWLGPRLYLDNPLSDIVDKLEEQSLKYTVQEVIMAQHEAALDYFEDFYLYGNRNEINAAFARLGCGDYLAATWKPHTVGVSFIFGTLARMPEIPAAIIFGVEYSRSVNMHSGLARTSECSDKEESVYRRSMLAKIYSANGLVDSDNWFSEIHEKRTRDLRENGITLNILDESLKDCFLHAAAYRPEHTLHGNANFGQVGLSDHSPTEASVYELARSAAQAFNQLGVAQAALLKATGGKHWRELLFLAVVRCAKDHDFPKAEYHANLGILVTFPLLKYISDRKKAIRDQDIQKLVASLRVIRQIYLSHRNRILATLRNLRYSYAGEKLTLATLIRKVRIELEQPGMTEANVYVATWEKIRGILARNHFNVYQEKIIAAERATLQTLVNKIYSLHYNRSYAREKPLEFFWELYEREEMKRTFPGLWEV